MTLNFSKLGISLASNAPLRVPGVLLSLFCLVWSLPLTAAPTNSFVYHRADGSVDADIKSGDLVSLLENISAATGWHVFLDPGARHVVSAKFKDLPAGPALHMLLGDVNFMVVPQTNGPSQLFVFRTAQRQATRRIEAPARPAKPIPRELVVTLKPGSKIKIEDLARSLNAKVIGRLNNSYLLQFADDAATQAAQAQLANNPDVSVDYNYPVDPPPPVQQAQSPSNPKLQLKPQPGNGNCQLIVGLIDTAIQPPAAGISSVVMPPVSVVGNYTPDPGQLTHGTAMMDTVAQALAANSGGLTSGAQGTVPATSVKILPVDVYGANETTSTFSVAQGVAAAINGGANVINMSLGSTGDSSVLRDIISQGEQRGIAFYAAAGNSPVTTPTYPAAYPGVVAVTASGDNGQIAPYANRGSFVQMMAPGDNVVGFNGQNYLVEGTSTATAFASGIAAGLADAHHACADDAQSLLKQSLGSTSIPTEAVDQ
jgi:hypothetical protein